MTDLPGLEYVLPHVRHLHLDGQQLQGSISEVKIAEIADRSS